MVLIDYNFYALVREDVCAASNCHTGYIAEGLLASIELLHNDVVDPLSCSS